MGVDDLDFPGTGDSAEKSKSRSPIGSISSGSCSSTSPATVTSNPLRSSLGRSKASRLKAKGLLNSSSQSSASPPAQVRPKYSQSSTSIESSALASTPSGRRVHFSQTSSASSKSSISFARKKYRRRKDWFEDDPVSSSKKQKVLAFDSTSSSSVKVESDAYAVQDSGALQMLNDEISFLCSHFGSKSPSVAADAMMDLATMLSDNKQRQTILGSVLEKHSPVESILKALGTSHRFSSKHDIETVRPVFDAMSYVWHFLSIDCTPENKTSTIQACNLRKTLLSHSDAIEGLLHLILVDQTISRLRGKATGALVMNENDEESIASSSVIEDALSSSPGSISTADSCSSGGSGSADPTAAGRRRKKRKISRRLPTIEEDTLSFASPAKESITRMLPWMKDIVLDATTKDHSCDTSGQNDLQLLPLVCLQRIISGKISEEAASCFDEDSDEENHENEEDNNPILVTNRLLAREGIIPLLALAFAESLAAASTVLEAEKCEACVLMLHDRIKRLASLVDGACLLSDENRRYFCKEGYTDEAGGYLVAGLVSLLRSFTRNSHKIDQAEWGDILLSTLRSLTSLTHECEEAAKEIESSRGDDRDSLSTIAELLFTAATTQKDSTNEKMYFDVCIFCLNTLTNLIESELPSLALSKVCVDKNSVSFCQWLCGWLVDQTASFQDAIIESSLESSPTKRKNRYLEQQEDEKLVITGNGFVFLACMLIAENEAGRQKSFEKELSKIPGNSLQEKIGFVKNVLKAFCNFYHFSVGDLSVAIITPVRKILMQLDQLLD